jgi:putative peptide zinc metalloprotease protein
MAKTFSDNWYRIADLRLGLRPTLSVRLHHYRDEAWYVLHEPTHNSFHRVPPQTWRFLSRLRVEQTVEEIWLDSIEQDPENTPGQEDVFQLLSGMYRSNLIYLEGGADDARLIERGQQKKKKPFLNRLSELMFMRLPLFDPERWLQAMSPLIQRVYSLWGAAVVLVILAWGLYELVLAGPRAWTQAQDLLQLDNVFLLYIAIFISKGLHEWSHAMACKRFGGEVRIIGVMLLLFTPLPYVDVSASWANRNRYERALVGAAGMMSDLVVAGIATVIWAHTAPGWGNELAYNLMFSAAIYTVIFNLNPLMRFDGYYILADLLGIPNLHNQAQAQFNRMLRLHVLRMDADETPALRPAATWGLVAFYVSSNLYRLFVMGGIVLFIADAYFGIGLLVAVSLALTSFVLPLQKGWRFVNNPLFRFQHKLLYRRASWAVAGLLVFFVAVPMPDHRVLPGVIEAQKQLRVFSETGGIVTAVHVQAGQWVEAGAPLVTLENPELRSEARGVQAQLVQTETQMDRSVTEGAVDLAPLQERHRTLRQLQATLQRQQEALVVRATHAGYWSPVDVHQRVQGWIARGADFGQVVDDRTHRFVGVIRQEQADVLSQADPDALEIRLEGDRGRVHTATRLTLIPHSQEMLPSAALSPMAGGEVPVLASDQTGRRAVEPFFLLHAQMETDAHSLSEDAVIAGRTAWIRLSLPWRPLAVQTWVAVRQFFQTRYQL